MTSPTVKLDHVIVAATTLEAGEKWVRDKLGVTVPRGGAHDHMATHNSVGRIGEDAYIEIIAKNPDDTPDRVRWFGLDDPATEARLARDGACLYHWAINTSDITATLAAAIHDPGPAIAMSRGDLNWQISVRDNGALATDGVVPTVIAWPDIPHPSGRMTDLGIRLESLTLHAIDPQATRTALGAIGVDHMCDVQKAETNTMTATFNCGGTIRTL